jgi:PAS domain S-box-containing protein
MKAPDPKKKAKNSDDPAELRRRAEHFLDGQSPSGLPNAAEADARRQLHELQVHQIELEMQNEELRRVRNEMEAGLEKYSDLYDFAPVGYLTLDREGIICEANLTSASLLGTERSRLIKRRLGLLLTPADLPAFNAFLAKVFESKGKEFCEVTLVKDGKPVAEVRIEAAVSALKRECRAVLQEISEHKRAEQDRLILNKLESTGILAGGLAHDFNNLLAVIVMNVELAQGINSRSESIQFLEAAKKAAMMARGLTQQLITFAQGGAPIRKATRLPRVIRDSARAALSGSPVECEFSLPEDLWMVEADEGQLGQVFRNLLLNAREAMPQGGMISIRAENVGLDSARHPSLPVGEYVRLSITDRGCGISKALLPKVFDPYFSTKQRGDQKGMGLGLTICHAIVLKHGGVIEMQSELGLGTTVQIHLPASRRAPVPGRAIRSGNLPTDAKILVMDDEEGLRTVMGLFLNRMGLKANLVEDGHEAIEAYQTAQREGRAFDGVILDLTIRGRMGGLETIQALLSLDPEVKAIVMSGYSDDPEFLAYERHGFKAALEKPFDLSTLQEALVRILVTPPNSRPA